MITWLLLIVLVPLVIVPSVLLFGFAGCGSFDEAQSTPLEVPKDLTAKALALDRIELKWNHANAGGLDFIVSVLGPDGKWNDKHTTVAKVSTVEISSLSEGALYSFHVRAALGTQESDKSNLASARTFRWQVAYDNQPTSSQGTFAGDSLVQRIDRGVFTFQDIARSVRLTLRAAGPLPLVLTQVSVSHAAKAGDDPSNPSPDPFDSTVPLVTFGPISLPPDGSAMTLPERPFAMRNDRDLLVAFDVSAINTGETLSSATNVGTSTLYELNDAQQAAVGNRSGFSVAASNEIYLVEKIEVLTGSAP